MRASRAHDVTRRLAPGHCERWASVGTIVAPVKVFAWTRGSRYLRALSGRQPGGCRRVLLGSLLGLLFGQTGRAVSPCGNLDAQGHIRGPRCVGALLDRMAFRIFDRVRFRSVSGFVMCRVVNYGRRIERAIMPLIEVVLFGFLDHCGMRLRQYCLSSLSTWLETRSRRMLRPADR